MDNSLANKILKTLDTYSVWLLSKVSPKEICDNTCLTEKQAKTLVTKASVKANALTKSKVQKGGVVLPAQSKKKERLAPQRYEEIDYDGYRIDENDIIRPFVEDDVNEVEDVEVVNDQLNREADLELDDDMNTIIEWLQSELGIVGDRANRLAPRIMSYLRDNFLLRLDIFTMREILDNNRVEIEEYINLIIR